MKRRNTQRWRCGLAVALILVAAGVVSACGALRSRNEVAHASASSVPSSSVPSTSSSSAPGTSTSPPTTSSVATTSTAPAAAVTAVASFTWSVAPVDAALRHRMSSSWRPGCPVGLEDLRYVRVGYWGFDAQVHVGELVVHADVVDSLRPVFRDLFAQRFAIRQMRLVDDFGGDDEASMAADNTSAFNCRPVAGTSHWSQHSYGRAIDVNPVENPYRHGGKVEPPAGAGHLDRSVASPGLIQAGGAVVGSFAAAGWIWGGTWSSSSDLQHFSTTGR